MMKTYETKPTKGILTLILAAVGIGCLAAAVVDDLRLNQRHKGGKNE
jgi:hypothetical protein